MEIHIQGSLIHYEVYGEGRPLICLHGFPEDHEVMTACVEPIFLNRQGYQRIYLDLPGMGKSKAKNIATADDMVGVIEGFIEAVIGKNQSFLLMGQSYGGYLALGLAARNSEYIEGLFLLCPCTVAERAQRLLPKRTIIARDADLVPAIGEESMFDDFLSMSVCATENNWQRYKKEVYPGLMRAETLFVNAYQKNGYALKAEAQLNHLTFEKPTVFLMGKQDDCVGYKDAFRFVDNFSRISYLVIDKAGHNLQIEQEEVFQSAFIHWLDEVDS